MTSQSDKTIYITGDETVVLVSDLVMDTFGSSRKRDNDFEMLVLQLVYVAYKYPNQWIKVPIESWSNRMTTRVTEIFKIFGDHVNRSVIVRQNSVDYSWEIMVQCNSPATRSMSGYTRSFIPGKLNQ